MKTHEKYISESRKLNLSDADVKKIKAILRGDKDLDDFSGLYDRLFYYYCDTGEMPYGVAKARTGMPDEWILRKLEKEKDLKSL